MASTRHRGKSAPIGGHSNGMPGFIARDSAGTAVPPGSSIVLGGIEMAATRHRGKSAPIGGHSNGMPDFIARDSACTAIPPSSAIIIGGI